MSSYFKCMNDMIIMNNIEELKLFRENELLTPVTPRWPLGHIKYNFCSFPPCMIVTKFDQNPIKCVEEETDCQKEERKRKKKK